MKRNEEVDRKTAVENVLGVIEKKYGKGAIMRLGQRETVAIPTITTGTLSIDAALGVGGVPKGRIIEIFGPESSGKTTLALNVVREAQKAGGTTAYIDAEHALDTTYAEALGVNTTEMLVSQPNSGEEALEITDFLLKSNGVDLIVIDSVAALVPRAELDGEMGDSLPGLQARLMSQALRKITGAVASSNTCLIFINQIREKIGSFYGPPETTSGGRALKFYSSMRIDIRRAGQIKEGDKITGSRTKIKIVKNKVAPPFRECEVDMMFGQGISREADLLDLGIKHQLVAKSGSWYSYKDERLGQGREAAIQTFKNHSNVASNLEFELRGALGLIKPDVDHSASAAS